MWAPRPPLRRRSTVLQSLAGVVLIALLLGLGLFAHAVAVHPAVRIPTKGPPVGMYDGPVQPPATLSPAVPLSGGALTIYVVDSRSQASSLQTAIENDPCRLKRVPACMDVLLIVSATDLDPGGSWLPHQLGQVLTPVDLRSSALSGGAAAATAPPRYHLLSASPTSVSGAGEVLVAGSSGEAARVVLALSTENAQRIAAGLPPVAVVDER
jgi:hypothetical protein